MSSKFDYTVVGAGLYGAVFARIMAEQGRQVLILEKKNHIAGMCYTERRHGIDMHMFGPHCFHTDNTKVWDFVRRFGEFNSYQLRVKARYKDKIYSLPINLMTLHQIWGVCTPEEAKEKLKSIPKRNDASENLESFIVNTFGEEVYRILFKGYTSKQWGRDPSMLPSFIVKRLPVRFNFDDRYHSHRFQGVPVQGYTALFERMLDHPRIRIELGADFMTDRQFKGKLVFTGNIDEFYDYRHGRLEYRSLRFEHETLEGDFQGNAIINYTDEEVPYTRIVEHKHFNDPGTDKTVITREYPMKYEGEATPFYPINNDSNQSTYEKYKAENDGSVIFGGRLATYKYLDMHQVVGQAMADAERELGLR